MITRSASRIIRTWGAVMLLLIPTMAAAETAYVIDRLLLGVHENKELTSAIIKVLPTATALEVLERDGNFARIRTHDGMTGWVDTSYIMSEKPAQLLVAELEAKRQELESTLTETQAQFDALQAHSPTQSDLPPVASDALRDLQNLAEENRFLKEQLATTAAATSVPENPAPSRGEKPVAATHGNTLSIWNLMLMGFLLLLAFAAGAYTVDFSVRRRHGGFRI